MGTKDSKIKKAVVASDDTHLTEKEEAIKNAIVASNGNPKTEEGNKKEASIKNVVAFSDNTSIDEKQENEKEAGIDLGILEMEPDIENMTLDEYRKYEAEKERRLWDNV
ncbi:hypothetical protein Tco_0849929 [Tanacetum coccineum]